VVPLLAPGSTASATSTPTGRSKTTRTTSTPKRTRCARIAEGRWILSSRRAGSLTAGTFTTSAKGRIYPLRWGTRTAPADSVAVGRPVSKVRRSAR